MSVNTTTSRITYAGNGVTLAFAFPYYFLQQQDLVVILTDSLGNETTQVLGTNYTVANAGVQSGGTVTMVVAPAIGYTLVILRDASEVQNLTLVENDPLPAAEVENAFDLLTMLVQRIRDLISRALVLPDGFASSFTGTLPNTLPADTVLQVNDAGTGFIAGPSAAQIAAAAANAAAAAASAAAAAASAASVVPAFITPETYGAIGNGTTDDTAAIQAALNAVPAAGGDVILSKNYRISAPLVPKNTTRIKGTRGAALNVATVISSTASQGFIQGTDLQNVSIKSIHFIGTGTWTSTPFANPYSAGNSVGFTNDDYGIKVNVTTGAYGIVIEDCYFEGLSRAVVINQNGSGLFAKNVLIKGNKARILGYGGIFLYETSKFVVSGNLIERSLGNITAAGDTTVGDSGFADGIGLNSCTDGVVSNNTIYDFRRCGLIIEPYSNPVGNGATTSSSANLTAVAAGTVTTIAALLVDNQTVGVSGTGIPTGTTVVSASGTTVVMSANATASATVTVSYAVYSSRLALSDNVITYQHGGTNAQDWSGIYVSDGSVQEPVLISDNSIYDIFGASTALSGAVNGDGIVAQGCHVVGGVVENCGGNGLTDAGSENSFKGVKVYNCNQYGLRVIHQVTGNLALDDCEFVNCGFAGVILNDCPSSRIKISGCLFVDNGLLTTPLGSGHEGLGLSGINIAGASSLEVLVIERNTFSSSAAPAATVGQLYGISSQVGVDYNEQIRHNNFIFTNASVKNTLSAVGAAPFCFATYFNTGGYTGYDLFTGLLGRGNENNKKAWTNSPDWLGAASSGFVRMLGYASTAPVSGTYRVGDAFVNSAVATAGPMYFLCVTAGSPGTWEGWGGRATMTDWVAYTPAVTNWTSVTPTGLYRRVGGDIEGQVQILVTGGFTGALIVALPGGLTFDTSRLINSTAGFILGYGAGVHSSNEYFFAVAYTTSSTVAVNTLGASGGLSPVTNTSPATWAPGDTVVFNFKGPITGWKV